MCCVAVICTRKKNRVGVNGGRAGRVVLDMTVGEVILRTSNARPPLPGLFEKPTSINLPVALSRSTRPVVAAPPPPGVGRYGIRASVIVGVPAGSALTWPREFSTKPTALIWAYTTLLPSVTVAVPWLNHVHVAVEHGTSGTRGKPPRDAAHLH